MKKLITLAIAAGLGLSGAAINSASADPICGGNESGGGCVTVGDDGYVLLIDGDERNRERDPFDASDGYAGVNGNGLQCSDSGDGYDYADNNGDGDTTDPGEKTATNDGCPPPSE